MEFNYKYGKKITAAIKAGTSLHEELEGEVNVPIILQPTGYADFLYKSLYTSYMALLALKKNKKTREVQVYGSISGYKIVTEKICRKLPTKVGHFWPGRRVQPGHRKNIQH